MKQEYTRSEIVSLLDALQQMFPAVRLADPATGCLLDPATMAPAGGACQIPALNDDKKVVYIHYSRRWMLPAADGCPLPAGRTPSTCTGRYRWMASPAWW